MKITCSILCYNYGRYLAKAIESCLNQKPGDYELEILVIDDGSTDETPEICQHYQDSIRVLRSENQGFGASLDKAILESSGDYVCLLDADDYFDNNKILALIPFMQKGYLYIEHTKYFINSDGQLINSTVYGGGNTSTLCLNRAAALSLLPVQNEIFFHPLKSAGHGFELDEPLTFYRIHDSSMIGSKPADLWYSHLAQITHLLADQLLSMSQQPPAWVDSNMLKKISREYRATAYYNQMEAALHNNKRRQAMLACLGILLAAMRSRMGLTVWHCKVIIRGTVLGRAIESRTVNI
ncbi:MAG: glycosyltransferase [Pelatocladus maniniholoensis HA4357-MV3]|jgi:glycosyltransferase involved in cell wall biosynthesis|uniref:Glycosyltransferase n=1 Tax=Pelatocladus maniniholoensis HA4357-MV3 TaxID=1117104 RepID=A0A9E3H7E9_9NOST|nr:glycosyltransferase [Pelatocladus maniniholoensis HA4357-MV3]